MTTLYESVLGDRFAALPPALRRFHARAGARAQGKLRVERGRGLLARLAGAVMGFPPASEGLTTTLEVVSEDGREVWTRRFSSATGSVGRPMVTRQWRNGAQLIEAIGPTRTFFDLESDAHGMRFVQRRCTVFGLPIPSPLAPKAEARAWSSDAEGWEVEVRISLPLIGLLVGYAGRFVDGDG